MGPLTGQRVGRFELLDLLGEGGAGVVYLAHDADRGRRVAIKLLTDGALLDPTEAQRLEREARHLSRISHPGIVMLHEYRTDAERPYIVMEYVQGRPITDAAAALEWTGKAALLRDTARALHFAHRRGLVHRDLKPANLLVNEEGQPKILDFGISIARDTKQTRLTVSGFLVGTPAYLSPEQARGERRLGPSTDIFAMGVIAYELLTGRLPFDSPSVSATVEKILFEDPAPPREVQPDVPEPLEAVCLKALEKSAARRYRTAAQLAADFGRFAEGKSVRARMPSAEDRFARRISRHVDELSRWMGKGYITRRERDRLTSIYEHIQKRVQP